jgi:hypothetical protein
MLFACETTKVKTNSISDLTVNAKGLSEGIYLYLNNIPKNVHNLSVFLYDITVNDELYIGTNIHDNDLEQIKNTNFLVCPFVKNGHEYEITVIAYIKTEENMKPINFSTTTAFAKGGIHIINNPILNWNHSNNITTLSSRPIFSDEAINSQNTALDFGLVFNNKESGGKVSGGINELTNDLSYDNTQNFNSIVEMISNIGLSGNIPIYADVALSLEYKNKKWTMVFAKTEYIIYSL